MGKTEWDGLDGGEASIPLSVPPQLPTTTTSPTLTDEEVGAESREEEPQKTQSQSHSCSFRSRLVILGGITNRMQGLKFNELSAFYGNLKYTSNYLQYKSNYTRRHDHGKYNGPASSTSSAATGPVYLERGQVIWKIQKERLAVTIVGRHFSQLVWNRPSSSTCGKAPAHWEKE